MTSITPENLKIGDVFYECEAGVNIEARVTEAPVESVLDVDGKPFRQWSWKAVDTQDGRTIDYLYTEGLSHYGPRIYDAPEYFRW